MHEKQMIRNDGMNEVREGLKFTLLISIAFFIASLLGRPPVSWEKVLIVSLGYGFSIYGMIWLSYALIHSVKSRREDKVNRDIELGFWGNFTISFVGLCAGAFLAEWQKAFVLGTRLDLTNVPFIIVIGSFISSMFIYRDQSKQHQNDKIELSAINKKLKEKQEKTYLSTIAATLGNVQKVIPVAEILFFKSIDHYTYAHTEDGEYIVDYSIKKLSSDLNPDDFVKIHRNCIVALSEITQIENGNQWFVKTRSGEELRVSRSSRRKLKESLLS